MPHVYELLAFEGQRPVKRERVVGKRAADVAIDTFAQFAATRPAVTAISITLCGREAYPYFISRDVLLGTSA